MPNTTVSRIVRALDNNNFDLVKRIIDSSRTSLPSTHFLTQNSIDDVNVIPNLENIKTDRGRGRVSEGLQFLELVSNIFKGKNVDSVLKFDKVKIFVNPKDFILVRDNDTKIQLISASLGFNQYMSILNQANELLFNNVVNRFIEIFNSVSTGTFFIDNFKNILPLMRVSAKTVEEYKKNRRGIS